MFRKVQHAPRYAKQSNLFVRTSEETQPKTFRKKSMSLLLVLFSPFRVEAVVHLSSE